jgi:hypothetical protein
MRITRGTRYYIAFALAVAAYIASVDLRLGLYWLAGAASGFVAGRCSVLGWLRPQPSWRVYTLRPRKSAPSGRVSILSIDEFGNWLPPTSGSRPSAPPPPPEPPPKCVTIVQEKP